MSYSVIRTARRATALCALTLVPLAACQTMSPGAMGSMDGTPRGAVPTDRASMERMMTGWAPASREAAAFMMNKYGAPASMSGDMLVWNRTGPWKRTIIYREAVPHNFPMPHPDVMEQFIDYRVPPALFDELAMYDGSVIVERTKGEMSARCDKEGANFLALNLAQEIATGKRTVADARRMYAEQITAMKAGRPAPYTERLMFSPMPGAMDPDRPAM
ncbi:MAG TPA: hypothetical protein VGV85_12440 [Longimicrobiaceae bacterium]|nr:hypothetical protein [Longimicrobiaceae bacterium]